MIFISMIPLYFLKIDVEDDIDTKFFELSKKFDYANYNMAYEFIQNFSRMCLVALLFMFNVDIKLMIYITLGVIFINVFFN